MGKQISGIVEGVGEKYNGSLKVNGSWVSLKKGTEHRAKVGDHVLLELEPWEYKGKTGEQALNELTNAGFDVQTQYVFSEDLPIGVVISQTPGAGSADKGSKITLLVSKGSEFVYVPNLFALTEAKAVAMLKDLQLKPVVKRVGTKKIKVVTNVSPKVGSKLKRGSTVTITVG